MNALISRVMSLKRFNALSQPQQQIIMKAAGDARNQAQDFMINSYDTVFFVGPLRRRITRPRDDPSSEIASRRNAVYY